MAGALLLFYVAGTTTPTPVYTDDTLSVPLSNPVVADGGGLFAAVFLDPSVTYRMQLQTSGGSVVADVDPVNVTVEAATSAQVNAGSATGVYVSPATLATWSGVLGAIGYTPLNKAGDTATNLLLSPSSVSINSAGYLGAPVNEQDANYTLALTDAGKLVRANSGAGVAYTVPPNTYPLGTVILIRNVGAGVVTITQGAGVTIYGAGVDTNKSWALAQWGLATLIAEGTNTWVVSGTGLS